MRADVPQAWPRLLTREQLCAYLGGVSESTVVRICTVPPIQLGVSLLRYDRQAIDAWIDSLPPRLLHVVATSQDAAEPAADRPPEPAASRTLSAVDRARARAEGKPCRKAS